VKILLNLPLPILMAPLAPQIPGMAPATVQDGPGWVAVFLLGAWVVLWVLKEIGKLPGQDRNAITVTLPEKRAHQFDEVHRIVTREDPEKPGYAMVWSSRAERDALQRTLDMARKTIESHEALLGVEISTLQAIQHSLAQVHAKLDQLAERGGRSA